MNELTQRIKSNFEERGIKLSKVQLISVYDSVKNLLDTAYILKRSITEQQAIDILVWVKIHKKEKISFELKDDYKLAEKRTIEAALNNIPKIGSPAVVSITQYLTDSRFCYNCFCSTDNVPIGPAALDSYCMFFNKALNDMDAEQNMPRLQECIERFGE